MAHMAPLPESIPVDIRVTVEVIPPGAPGVAGTIEIDRTSIIREYLEMVDVDQLSAEVMAGHDPSRNLFEGVLRVLHAHADDA